jgi:hypothetical protein
MLFALLAIQATHTGSLSIILAHLASTYTVSSVANRAAKQPKILVSCSSHIAMCFPSPNFLKTPGFPTWSSRPARTLRFDITPSAPSPCRLASSPGSSANLPNAKPFSQLRDPQLVTLHNASLGLNTKKKADLYIHIVLRKWVSLRSRRPTPSST